jgi:hypothetical protein
MLLSYNVITDTNKREELKVELKSNGVVNPVITNLETVVRLRIVCLDGVTYYHRDSQWGLLAVKRTIDDKLVSCTGNELETYTLVQE